MNLPYDTKELCKDKYKDIYLDDLTSVIVQLLALKVNIPASKKTTCLSIKLISNAFLLEKLT